MAQMALYLDDETARWIDQAARKEGISRSAWVRKLVEEKRTESRRRFPDSFYQAIGSWQDERSIEEIMRDIRQGPPDRERQPLD